MKHKIKELASRIAHKFGHQAEHVGHCAYLALVGIGTPLYKYAALVLLVFVVINLIGEE